MTPELLSFDEGTAAYYKGSLKNKIIPEINALASQFNELGIGPLTNERLRDLLFAGGSQVSKELEAGIDSQIRKSGLKSQRLADQLRNEVFESLDEVSQRLSKLKEIHATFPREIWDAVSFVKSGNAHLSPESEKAIDELCKIYIKTEQGINLRDKHRKAQDALNEFLAELKIKSKVPYLNWSSLSLFFDIPAIDAFEVQLKDINYDVLTS